ncbi:hypothetical protein EDD15DRAFT_2297989 [Pisolithus albus]|nr:hypothetical protein EDD15DRAFT_2325481 [Pisolithus albus]KAI5986494.1 hypothetical protein EDD15DRAFT_2297989 [Pisolithus albus]
MFLFSYLYSVFLLSVWTSFGLGKLDSYLPCTSQTEIQARRLRILFSPLSDRRVFCLFLSSLTLCQATLAP